MGQRVRDPRGPSWRWTSSSTARLSTPSTAVRSTTFTEALSLLVSCGSQEEVDELWEKLGDGGEPGPCGWLKDRYGLSWQIVPVALGEMLSDPDSAKSQRVMEAMLQMGKIDVARLRQAYEA